MKIATIILNYNSSKDTIKCLNFLRQQQNVDLHIIVVDNCSQEQDRCAVEQECVISGIEFIVSFENRGYSAGNNIGLRRLRRYSPASGRPQSGCVRADDCVFYI